MKVIDMHCDTIMQLYADEQEGIKSCLAHNDYHIAIDKMRAGDYLCQCFAIFVNLSETTDAFDTANEMIDVFYRNIEANKEDIALAKSGSDIENNLEQGKMSALLTIEEGSTCGLSLAKLRNLYRLGVRMITLTWNYENGIGYPNVHKRKEDGSLDVLVPEERGLTDFGMAMIKEMERLGIIIDVSHLSDGGFWDVYNNTTKPFVASHSNARAVSPHVRNLSDDMIKALALRGGVLGINYHHGFLDLKAKESTVAAMVKQISYIKNLAGIDVIGLGSDFDGIPNNLEMADASKLSMLQTALQEAGFSEEEIEKIFYKNVLRVFKSVLG